MKRNKEILFIGGAADGETREIGLSNFHAIFHDCGKSLYKRVKITDGDCSIEIMLDESLDSSKALEHMVFTILGVPYDCL